MIDDSLLAAISQTIDALTFSQTHEIDLDFRAHTKSTVSSVRSLQQEQRNRIELEYGARQASPEYLGAELLAEYRGEAASVQLAMDSGDADCPTVISRMTNAQCRAFKKEMKQRIHEWEAAVRGATGKGDVAVEQKSQVRAVYQLYKAIKHKVVTEEDVGRDVSVRSSTRDTVSQAPSEVSVMTSTRETGGGGGASHTSGHWPAGGGLTHQMGGHGGSNSNTAYSPVSMPSVAGNTQRAETSMLSLSAVSPGAAWDSGSSLPVAPGEGSSVGSRIARVPIGTTPVMLLSEAQLVAEKRRIKQVLHSFEEEYERVHGDRPNRPERREFSREYHRYGELKNEIARRQERASSQAGSVASSR